MRYDSPTFAGFSVSADWGQDNYWDAYARYAGEWNGIKLAAVTGWSQTDGCRGNQTAGDCTASWYGASTARDHWFELRWVPAHKFDWQASTATSRRCGLLAVRPLHRARGNWSVWSWATTGGSSCRHAREFTWWLSGTCCPERPSPTTGTSRPVCVSAGPAGSLGALRRSMASATTCSTPASALCDTRHRSTSMRNG